MGYQGAYQGLYQGSYQGEVGEDDAVIVAYEHWVAILENLRRDPYGWRVELDVGAYAYRAALVAGSTHVGILAGSAKTYEYRGSLEPQEETVMSFSMVVGDRLPSLTRVCKNAETGSAVDLTGGTAVGKLQIEDANGNLGTLKTVTCVIVTAASGIVRFDWAAGDIDTAGTAKLRAVVTVSGKTMTFPSDGTSFEFPVAAALS